MNDFHMACWRARCFDNGIYMIVSGGNGERSKKYKSYGCIIDPFGHGWIISTPVEDVEPAEMTGPMAG